jgi:hypothetical protein
LPAHTNSYSNADSSIAKLPKIEHVAQQQADSQQRAVAHDSKPQPPATFISARSDTNMDAVRERLATLSQNIQSVSGSASSASHAAGANDRMDNKQRKPPKPAPNAVPLGRLKAESSAGSIGSSVKGDDDWDEPDSGLLTLENFDQNGSSEGVVLNSPRSIEVICHDDFRMWSSGR